MKKTILITIIVIILAVAAFLAGRKPATAPAPETTETPFSVPTKTPTDIQSAPTSRNFQIIFADGKPNPSSLNIKAGDSVTFINNDEISHWPASGVHPTHQICKGFDALRRLNKGETYTFIFKEAKTCPFHDHPNSSTIGQIIVNP